MNRKNIKRILVTLGITAGVVTATAGSAAAAMNHTNPRCITADSVASPGNRNKEKPMNRKNIKRILVTLGITAGIVTATAGSAAAAMNHSEPTLRSR